MRRRLFKNVMTLAIALLSFLATTTAASACVWGAYQPKEPKSL